MPFTSIRALRTLVVWGTHVDRASSVKQRQSPRHFVPGRHLKKSRRAVMKRRRNCVLDVFLRIFITLSLKWCTLFVFLRLEKAWQYTDVRVKSHSDHFDRAPVLDTT